MKLKLLGLFAFFFLTDSISAQDYWLPKDTVNGSPKSAATSFVLDNRAYVVAGTDDLEYKRKMYSYTADQDDWDDELSLGGVGGEGLGRVGASAFALEQNGQAKGYVCLGQTQTIAYMNDLWEYDRNTDAWTQKANFTGAPRKEAIAFVVDNIAYVGTGNSATGLKKDFFAYDPSTNSWAQISDFAGTARRCAVAFSMEAYGFVGTGDDGTLRQDFWMYDPQNDQWIQKANFPGAARSGACGWAAFPVCYLGTGEDANHTYHQDLWEYNYYLNNWTQRANLPGPGRKNAVAFYLDGWGFIGTGYNNGAFYDDLWAYSGTADLEDKEAPSLTLWPNPTVDYLSVQGLTDETSVRVFSASGMQMHCAIWQQDAQMTIDTKDLPIGTYYMAYELNHTTYHATFVKCN